MITYLFEQDHLERSEFINSRFREQQANINQNMTPIAEKRELYAKLLVKHLYENMVYREDFETEEKDKASFKFANFIVNSERVLNNINSKTMNGMPATITEDQIFDLSDSVSDNLTRMWVEDARQQIFEIDTLVVNAEENGKKLTENQLSSKFSVFKEFNDLDNIEESNSDADVASAMITNLSPEEKMDLAIKQSAFKNCLENLGVDVNSKIIANRINEEFKRSLYL